MAYITAIADKSLVLKTLSTFDEAGWELVSHTWMNGFFHLIFKEKS